MSTYKMDWKENDIVKSDDMNRIEENVYNTQELLDTKLDTSGDGSNLSSIFTQASVRENINSGDSLKTIMAKMKKWFSDLKPLAFKEKVSMEDLEQTVKTMVNNALQSSAVANNLTTTNEKMVLGAPMGKELSEQISELNQNLVYNAGEIVYKNRKIGWCEQQGKIVIFSIHLEFGEVLSGGEWHNNMLTIQGVDMPNAPVFLAGIALDSTVTPAGVARVQMSIAGAIDVLANVSFSGLVVTGTYLVR